MIRKLDTTELPNEADIRAALRTLPSRTAPPDLKVRLRVAASREAVRRRSTWWNRVRQELRLWSDNAMRPFAVPAAGGVMSAVVLFSALAPSLTAPGNHDAMLDTPTAIYRSATIEAMWPFEFDDVELELTIDDRGRMLDYEFADAHCNRAYKSADMRRALEQKLLLTKFRPATAFGQPTNGKMRVTFRTGSSRIDVKG